MIRGPVAATLDRPGAGTAAAPGPRRRARRLKPGGRLLLRDYGRFDEAQLRLKKGTRLGEHHYVKADGTCCFYFEVDDVAPLFARHFETVSLGLDCRQEANRATRQRRRRVFVRGQFRKR